MLIDDNINTYIVDINSKFEVLLSVLSKKVNANFGSGFAIIVDHVGKIVGIVEDADLRKFLLKYPDKKPQINEIVRRDIITVNKNLNKQELINSIVSQINLRGWATVLPVRIVPVIDEGKPVGLIDIVEIQLAIQQNKNNYIILGLGYVGLTLALSLARLGRNVFGIDTNQHRIEQLNKYNSYVVEPGIDPLLKTHLNNNLRVDSKLDSISKETGVKNIYFICVGSPLGSDKKPDLQPIWLAVEDLLKVLKPNDAIVMRSTVPVGFGREIISLIEAKLKWKVGNEFNYIAAPERTVEGDALKEIKDLPQILSGATDSCQLLGLSIFQDLANSVTPIAKIESAELVKVMSNAYRDYIFGFSNYFIDICQNYRLDINLIIEASNRGYPRSTIPSPSPGVGGPCLSKDSYFLPEEVNSIGVSPLIAARRVNESIPEKSAGFIKTMIPHITKFKCLGIGIAFKGVPDTNDLRNSPSLDFLNAIKKSVRSINIWDTSIVDEDSKLDFPVASHLEEYNFYAILNNNPKNLGCFNNRILRNKSSEVIVFDPWRMLTVSQISTSNNIKVIHYFSLSLYQKVFL